MNKLIPWALAVCLAAAALWMGQLYLMARSEIASLEQREKLADLELRSARNQLEAERIVSQRELADIQAERDRAIQGLSESRH